MVFDGFRPPDFDAPVSLAAHIAALPANATSKGMFFNALFQRVQSRMSPEQLAKKAGIAHRSYLSFGDYSMRDNMRLTVAAAEVMFPMNPLGHAMRELGAGAFEAFRGSHLGRAVLSLLDVDPSAFFRVAPKVYGSLFNFGRLDYQRVADGHCRLIASRLPIFIETFQVGAIEGALRYTRCVGHVELALDSISDAMIDIHWRRVA